MGRSQLTHFRARTTIAGHSLLTKLHARTVSATSGHSLLTKFHAQTSNQAHSRLTRFRAQNLSGSGPTAVITGPSTADVGEVIVLSLVTSFGGTFTGYVWTQIAGPTAASFVPSGNQVTITAPAAKPNTAAFPNDAPLTMTFQGVVQVAGGAQSDGDIRVVTLLPHLTWDADGTPRYWHLSS